MEEYIGIIKLFSGNFAPKGYMYCSGQVLQISQYTALYSLLGTTYGGDGVSTFNLPDLRSRVPVGGGMGSGSTTGINVASGEVGGEVNHTLLLNEMPAHGHNFAVSNQNAAQSAATNGVSIATPGASVNRGFTGSLGFVNDVPNTPLNNLSISQTGGSAPHNNMQPYLGLSYIICTEGVYPSRQ